MKNLEYYPERLSYGGPLRKESKSGNAAKGLEDDAATALGKARKALVGKDSRAPVHDVEDLEEGNDSDHDGQRQLPQLDSEDDSDHDHSQDEDAEADAILAELMDDVALDFEEEARQGLDRSASPVDSPPSLPPPPSLITPVNASSHTKTSSDPGPAEEPDETEDDFSRRMKARMSALGTPSPGLKLPAAPSSQPVDSLGLPSAPSTKPVDASSDFNEIRKQPKEDYICKICYAPATIFCEGCEEEFEEFDTKDDAMYCARCWKEMHLGEAADEEERQHQWVTVTKGRYDIFRRRYVTYNS